MVQFSISTSSIYTTTNEHNAIPDTIFTITDDGHAATANPKYRK